MKFEGQVAQAFGSHLKVLSTRIITMANAIRPEQHGFGNKHVAFCKAKLDGVGGGAVGPKSVGGGDSEDLLAVGGWEHSVKELLRVKEIQGSTK